MVLASAAGFLSSVAEVLVRGLRAASKDILFAFSLSCSLIAAIAFRASEFTSLLTELPNPSGASG